MKKDLLKTNCFDVEEKMIIIGSCLEYMFPKIYNELNESSENIYDVCLEETHLNMVITKLAGMIARKKCKELTFVTVDKSPHCVQLHYVVKELENMMDLKEIKIKNYVATNEGLVEIPIEVIGLSKNLSKFVYENDNLIINKFESWNKLKVNKIIKLLDNF